jgi:hypothetical protein
MTAFLVVYTVRLGIMRGMYCIEPLGRIYRSTWLGGQVASPRDKEGSGSGSAGGGRGSAGPDAPGETTRGSGTEAARRDLITTGGRSICSA